MSGHDFLSGYSAKILEYALAVGYLALFVGFWQYVQGGGKRSRPQPRAERAPAAGWFGLPADVALHPGHTWARMLADGTVAVGLDDLGHRLVGPVDRVVLPRPGEAVEQGAAAVRLDAAGKSVKLVSPVDGEVVAYNAALPSQGAPVEPYGDGWLFKVRPSNWRRSRAQLIEGQAARDWVEEQARLLEARLARQPAGALLQDGGAPIHGIAREIDPEHWDDLARQFFRTEEA